MKQSIKLLPLILALLYISVTSINVAMAEGPATQSGMASWYGPKFHGRTMANGQPFNMHALTAAHKTLPFGTMVLVTNKANGKAVMVEITDRGPYIPGRIIDLSKGSAEMLGIKGVSPVSIMIIHKPSS